MKPYDLHNHTIVSKDGKITPKQLIDLVASRGMKGVGISDHDEFPDETLYDYAHQKGIKLALGIEFTTDKAHIIGYNMNIVGEDQRFLSERFDRLREDYVNVAKKIIEGLQGAGVNISYEAVQKQYDKEFVQKLFVMKYLAEELKLYPSWAEARKDLQNKCYYIKDGVGVEKLSPFDTIDLIHRAGGFAIWAHPYITPENVRDKYFQQFAAKGIDAVEASYSYRENGYKGNETNEELEKIVRARLKTLNIPISGGSDSHYPLKTYSDLSPITPGDVGISDEEFVGVSRAFR